MDTNKIVGGIFTLIAVYLIFAGRDTRGKLSAVVETSGNTAVDLIQTLQGRGNSGTGRMGLQPIQL